MCPFANQPVLAAVFCFILAGLVYRTLVQWFSPIPGRLVTSARAHPAWTCSMLAVLAFGFVGYLLLGGLLGCPHGQFNSLMVKGEMVIGSTGLAIGLLGLAA